MRISDPGRAAATLRSAAAGSNRRALGLRDHVGLQAVGRLSALAPDVEQRQAVAELLQAIPVGRAVINLDDHRWALWLTTDEPSVWSQDCRRVVEDGASQVRWRERSVLVEVTLG